MNMSLLNNNQRLKEEVFLCHIKKPSLATNWFLYDVSQCSIKQEFGSQHKNLEVYESRHVNTENGFFLQFCDILQDFIKMQEDFCGAWNSSNGIWSNSSRAQISSSGAWNSSSVAFKSSKWSFELLQWSWDPWSAWEALVWIRAALTHFMLP